MRISLALRRLHGRLGTQPFSTEQGILAFGRPGFAKWAAAAPKDEIFTFHVLPAGFYQIRVTDGAQISQLRRAFNTRPFSTGEGAKVTGRLDFLTWAAGNPHTDEWQVIHLGGDKWRMVSLSRRLADKVMPRLIKLKEPFNVDAASSILMEMPIPATNTILSVLVQNGFLRCTSAAGTYRVASWSMGANGGR